MPIYSLYLSTQITSPASNRIVPINKTNLASVSWLVDWDALFRGNTGKVENCRVRFHLSSETWAASGTDWSTYNGYLSCSLASNFNAQTTNGTILGIVSPSDCPTTGTSTHCYTVNTLTENGVSVNVPTGQDTFTLQFYNDDAMTLLASVPEYAIMLTFELY